MLRPLRAHYRAESFIRLGGGIAAAGVVMLVWAATHVPQGLDRYTEVRSVRYSDVAIDTFPSLEPPGQDQRRERLLLTADDGTVYRTRGALWGGYYDDATFARRLLAHDSAEVWLDRQTGEIVGLRAGPVHLVPPPTPEPGWDVWGSILGLGVVMLPCGVMLWRRFQAAQDRADRARWAAGQVDAPPPARDRRPPRGPSQRRGDPETPSRR